MTTYYHGTPEKNLRSIEKKGVCPPNSCPVKHRDWWGEHGFGCDTNGVYLTTDFNKAVEYGAGPEPYKTRGLTIFKFSSIPRNCRVIEDDAAPDSVIVEDCGCLKPKQVCFTYPDMLMKPSSCSWGKV